MNGIKKLFLIVFLMLATNSYAAEITLKSGDFIDSDSRHQGEGGAVLIQDGDKQTLKFVNHFYVTPGPDLYVWLVKTPSPKNSQDVIDSESIELAEIISPSGKQSYTIPANIDASQYGSVVIWCKEFGVLFAHAELK